MASLGAFNEVQYLADSLKFFVNYEINLVKIIDKLEAMLTVRLKIQIFFKYFIWELYIFRLLKCEVFS